MIDSLIVLIITSITCSLLGVFLILRNLSMLTDAISHTVLLGIVLAYFLVKDLDSPLLIIGASLIGLLTVYLVENIGKRGISKYDDAIGMVFPIFFALAVILISKFFRNVHLDTDVVLMGEVLFSSLVTANIFGHQISVAIVYGILILILTILFIIINYQKLKISTFDNNFAYLIGIPTSFLFYGLMTLTSITSVISFNSVGAILVISFFIGPGASSLQLVKSLKSALIVACIIAAINSIVGFYLALFLNVSVAGFIAFINMITYLAILLVKKYIKYTN
ncbi:MULTISPECIES: metal ABC transporter permease [Anaerococcus]|jgi:mn2+, zn2+ ABC superfamily ATP binding cassette transporter, membrane protein|uniref:Metal ABC transporter permease n=1 Tax=Anaerococcus nagyae TaxID=1755241 RepID=A0A3E2TKX2_9FIRM|nr:MULTISPECIES: metal ABC transporter permease [Anaerococcus]MBP2069073.1 manganese/zinc/iron transport system permease protein [Anaerococcus nagyae]MDU1828123.1 metal ABC transporter permease [Anaerococcus sp.]MDU1864328.1 metal ABC transporter permease [Anaerococcus sp.]MDU2354158.1 metal ABC transporter permease [Anaerococcus sp.]MDU2565264.1 metal ABC transporter permease [Anaerococcus sp.]